MKVFAVPTVTAGATALLSMVFYSLLARQFGDVRLGEIVSVQAAIGLYCAFLVPQCWVYVIGGFDQAEIQHRFRNSVSIEFIAIVAAGAVLALLLPVLGGAFSRYRVAAGLVYVSFAIQASTSCLGWLRGTERWRSYALWNIGPNLVRVPLLVAWRYGSGPLGLVLPLEGLPGILLVFFVGPDLLRYLFIYLPIALRNWRWEGVSALRAAFKTVSRNWAFDLGSSVTETADKLVVGAALGPALLIPYFFARKLGVATVMVLEPFFAEQFRRGRAETSTSAVRIHIMGFGLALGIFACLSAAFFLGLQVPPLRNFAPTTVVAAPWVFLGVLAVEALISANRWSRYLSRSAVDSGLLLGIRLVVFSLFALNLWLVGRQFGGWGLVGSLALSWAIETVFVVWLTRRAVPADVRASGSTMAANL